MPAPLDLKKRYRQGLPGEAPSPGVITEALSRLVFLETPVNLISWEAATDWTDCDISAYTGDYVARAALLSLILHYLGATSSPDANEEMIGYVRKKGSSETTMIPQIQGCAHYDVTDAWALSARVSTSPIVQLDDSQIFETKLAIITGNPLNISFKVDLIGFFT